MKAEIQIWILMGLMTATSAVLMYILKMSTAHFIKKMEVLVDRVGEIAENVKVHHVKIGAIQKKNKRQDDRINRQDEKINKLEINQKNQI